MVSQRRDTEGATRHTEGHESLKFKPFPCPPCFVPYPLVDARGTALNTRLSLLHVLRYEQR